MRILRQIQYSRRSAALCQRLRKTPLTYRLLVLWCRVILMVEWWKCVNVNKKQHKGSGLSYRVTMSALAAWTAILRGSWPCSSTSVCDAPLFRNRHTWLYKSRRRDKPERASWNPSSSRRSSRHSDCIIDHMNRTTKWSKPLTKEKCL